MVGSKILCVAEKPAVAKAVATHLSGGALQTRSIRGNQYVKNYQFQFNFPNWGNCDVVMTCVSGHLVDQEFDQRYRSWQGCSPGQLFEADIVETIKSDLVPVAQNIQQQARFAKVLFIWTDCDREGEYIGTEIRAQARKGNTGILVKRARFSNTERSHVLNAARNPIDIDERQANAVGARIELDLRIGAAFTRLQTLQLQKLSEQTANSTLSYGSCQFPTLGFVVDRYQRVRSFRPETFWTIKVIHTRDNIPVNFNWKRVHLFDRAVVTIIFEQCLTARWAKVSRVQTRPTSKWRPLPLTTVELQIQGSRLLRMTGHEVMVIAEKLYQNGFISYPRTETDQFSNDFDLRALIQNQFQSSQWGSYAQELVDGRFRLPRAGRHNDQAHPPIHPVSFVAPSALNQKEQKVYEFIARRFLACCSDDAKGEATDVDIQWATEIFSTHGLVVKERNYLEVYPYDKWQSSTQLPAFIQGETFEPTEANVIDGATTKPHYLTEPELLGLMDANGIGTDATMADHIVKIKERHYVSTKPRDGQAQIQEFIPTYLGVALIEGYDKVGLDVSVGKPFLRKEMELKMKAICEGRRSKTEVVQESLDQYRDVFLKTQREIEALKKSFVKYVVEQRAD